MQETVLQLFRGYKTAGVNLKGGGSLFRVCKYVNDDFKEKTQAFLENDTAVNKNEELRSFSTSQNGLNAADVSRLLPGVSRIDSHDVLICL